MQNTPEIGISILETCRAAARELTSGHAPFAHRHALRQTYENVLASPAAQNAAAQADRLFSTVVSFTPKNEPELRRFAHGWSDTHVSSDLVGLLALRLHKIGAHQAAGDMMHVIADDIGANGKPHRDMFATFANALCEPNGWRNPDNAVSSCTDFRRYLHQARVKAPEAEAILTTAASEIWNVGEYTVLAEKFLPWMQNKMGLSLPEAKKANAYVQVHAGQTELDHFLCAIDAWDKLASHTKIAQPVDMAGQVMHRYLQEIGKAYGDLADAIAPQQPARSPSATMSAISAMPGGIR